MDSAFDAGGDAPPVVELQSSVCCEVGGAGCKLGCEVVPAMEGAPWVAIPAHVPAVGNPADEVGPAAVSEGANLKVGKLPSVGPEDGRIVTGVVECALMD